MVRLGQPKRPASGIKMSSPENKSRLNRLITVMAAIIALVGGYYLGNQYKAKQEQQPQQLQATVIEGDGLEIRPFTLERHEQDPFTEQSLRDKWTMVYFGYTFCPDICPMSLTKLVQVFNRLAEEKELLKRTQVVFISVDPDRDTPERMREYSGFFHKDFIGATADAETIARVAKDFGTYYRINEPDENGNYPVDHSSTITLVNPEGRIVALFGGAMESQAIADEFLLISKQ